MTRLGATPPGASVLPGSAGGRGESEQKVVEWLEIAAPVPGFIGFAVGRSTFLQTIKDLQAGKIDKATGAKQVSEKFLKWIAIFEKAGGK